MAGVSAQIETLVDHVENEGRECVLSFILKAARKMRARSCPSGLMGSFRCALFGLVLALLPTNQFPINLGNLLQVFFDQVIVGDPPANLLDLVGGHRTAAAMRLVQSNAQIPHWSVIRDRIYSRDCHTSNTAPSGSREAPLLAGAEAWSGLGAGSARPASKVWRDSLFPPIIHFLSVVRSAMRTSVLTCVST